jgi:hypothetical protein
MPNYLDGTLGHARRILGIHIRGRKGKQAVCVGKALVDKKFGSRKEVQDALSKAAKDCGK